MNRNIMRITQSAIDLATKQLLDPMEIFKDNRNKSVRILLILALKSIENRN